MSDVSLVPDEELDCRKMNCPMPVLKTKKALVPLDHGQILKVVATDPGSVADMAAFSRRTGHEIVGEMVDEGKKPHEFIFFFRRA